jgi:hypothetical protein
MHTRAYTHTQAPTRPYIHSEIYNIYCFSTATMVSQRASLLRYICIVCLVSFLFTLQIQHLPWRLFVGKAILKSYLAKFISKRCKTNEILLLLLLWLLLLLLLLLNIRLYEHEVSKTDFVSVFRYKTFRKRPMYFGPLDKSYLYYGLLLFAKNISIIQLHLIPLFNWSMKSQFPRSHRHALSHFDLVLSLQLTTSFSSAIVITSEYDVAVVSKLWANHSHFY